MPDVGGPRRAWDFLGGGSVVLEIKYKLLSRPWGPLGWDLPALPAPTCSFKPNRSLTDLSVPRCARGSCQLWALAPTVPPSFQVSGRAGWLFLGMHVSFQILAVPDTGAHLLPLNCFLYIIRFTSLTHSPKWYPLVCWPPLQQTASARCWLLGRTQATGCTRRRDCWAMADPGEPVCPTGHQMQWQGRQMSEDSAEDVQFNKKGNLIVCL